MRVGAEHGFTMFEYDVKLSRDNVLVLMHDDDVDRTRTATARPPPRITSNWRSWISAAGTRPPTPASRCPPSPPWPATPSPTASPATSRSPCPGREAETGRAAARWRPANCGSNRPPPLLSSFAEEALAAALQAAPELPRALLVEKVLADWLARLQKYQCVALNINQKDATRELIDAVHAAGYRIAAWTVNDPERARLLLDWGIDGIFTDELAAIRPVQA